MRRINLFGAGLILRVTALTGMALALGQVFWNLNFIFLQIVLSVLIVLLAVDLYRYIQRTNERVTLFLGALEYGELGIRTGRRSEGRSFERLSREMDRVLDQARQEKARQISLQEGILTWFENEGYGVMLTDNSGEVIWQNSKMQSCLGDLEHMEDLNQVRPGIYSHLLKEGHALFTLQEEPMQVSAVSWMVENQIKRLVVLCPAEGLQGKEERKAWMELVRSQAHESLNNLGVIRSLLESSRDMIPDGSHSTEQNTFHKHVEVMLQQTDALIDWANHTRQFFQVSETNKDWVQWNSLLMESAKDFERRKGNRIRLNLPDLYPEDPFYGDRSQWMQIMANLFNNAHEALKKEEVPEISVLLSQSKMHFKLEVRDNGVGIEPRSLSRIFVPFYSRAREGSGLGLGIVRHLVEEHNGSIRVLSDPGDGTSIKIRIPSGLH